LKEPTTIRRFCAAAASVHVRSAPIPLDASAPVALRQELTHALQQTLARAAPTYSITSSARASTAIGNERPSSFAVLRLMISSIFVDWETGSSAGFSPLRIFVA